MIHKTNNRQLAVCKLELHPAIRAAFLNKTGLFGTSVPKESLFIQPLPEKRLNHP